MALCPYVPQDCQDQKYVDRCKSRFEEDVVFTAKTFKQSLEKAREVEEHNYKILCPYCWRRR